MNDIAELAKRTALLTQSTRLQSEQMQQLSRKLLSSIQFFRLPESATIIQDDNSIEMAQALSAAADLEGEASISSDLGILSNSKQS
jgi:hypothetical protein